MYACGTRDRSRVYIKFKYWRALFKAEPSISVGWNSGEIGTVWPPLWKLLATALPKFYDGQSCLDIHRYLSQICLLLLVWEKPLPQFQLVSRQTADNLKFCSYLSIESLECNFDYHKLGETFNQNPFQFHFRCCFPQSDRDAWRNSANRAWYLHEKFWCGFLCA